MATTNYPGSLDAYPVPNNGDTISVADHWLGPAVIGIETELGTDPAGTFTDVKSRLDDVDDKVITEIDQWRISSSYSSSNNQVISSNWERADTGGFGQKGTGLTESSGYFSFPEAGYYKIDAQSLVLNSTSASPELQIHVTTDNSNYSTASRAYTNVNGRNSSIFVSYIFKVTNITNCKFVFVFFTNSGSSITVSGDSNMQTTGFNCTRLGDV